jgi:hypothetical protein
MTHRIPDPLPKLLAWAALLAFLLLIGASCGGQTGGTPDGNPDEGNVGDTQGPSDVRETSGGSGGKKATVSLTISAVNRSTWHLRVITPQRAMSP